MSGDGTVSWRSLLADAARLIGDRQHARWLCEDVSGWRGAEFTLHLAEPATERAVARVDALIARRVAGEPLQYVLGAWSFRTLDLLVDPRVLIPRPETEVVVGVALDRLAGRPGRVRAADLGTGSGAIALSLAAERPVGSTEVWATDISHDALDVARANLAGIGRLGTRVSICHGPWFDALPGELRGTLDLVVSNPPYVADDDPDLADDVRAWEPAAALFGGHDGLAAYTEIIAHAPEWLAPGGWLVLEIGSRQGQAVAERCRRARLLEVAVLPDYAGLDRVVVAQQPHAD